MNMNYMIELYVKKMMRIKSSEIPDAFSIHVANAVLGKVC